MIKQLNRLHVFLAIACCAFIGCSQSTQQTDQHLASVSPTRVLTSTVDLAATRSFQATTEYVEGVLNAMSDSGYPEYCRSSDQFLRSASAIAISPSSNRMALSLERVLYIIELPLSVQQQELTLPTRLSPYPTQWVAWLSPDHLLIASARVNGTGLYILDLAGNETELIAPTDNVSDYALATDRESVAFVQGRFLYSALNLSSIADKSSLSLTSLAEVVEVKSPSWHPDGPQIAFSAETFGDLEGYQNIFTADVDSGRLTQITSLACDYQPQWSPAGNHIAFLRAFQEEPTRLTIISLATGRESIVTTAENVTGDYQWNSIGSRLTYMLSSTENSPSAESIYSYDLSTEQSTKIDVGCCINAAAWGLNEQLWLLLTDRDAVWLYQIDPKTGTVMHAYLLNTQ